MGKRSDSLLTYTYTDSERLKEAFFSPPKKKKAGFAAIKKIIIASIAGILLAGSVFLFLQYDLIIISKEPVKENPPAISVLADTTLSSFKLFKGDIQITEESTLPVDIILADKEKATMVVDFVNPLDLKENEIFLYLKKADIPLNIGIIARDKKFFSNSLSPLVIKIDSKSPFLGALKIPVDLKENSMQNVNLSQIERLKLYFWIPEGQETEYESTLSQEAEWVVIKDLVIINKEGL